MGTKPRARPGPRRGAAAWAITTEEPLASGGPFELVQRTLFHVIDEHAGRTLHTFEGRAEASFDGPGWGPSTRFGVIAVCLSRDRQFAVATHADGSQERLALPSDVPCEPESRPEPVTALRRCSACASTLVDARIGVIGGEGFLIITCTRCDHVDAMDEYEMNERDM